MKNTIFTSCLLAIISLFALQNMQAQSTQISILPTPKKVYLGFGTGINNYPGLIGLSAEVTATNQIGIFGTAGFGSWGGKLGIGGRYYFADARGGSAISLGLSRASGVEDLEIEMEVITANGDTENQEITMDYKPVSCLNLAYVFAKNLKNKNKILFSVGYSARLSSDTYTVVTGETLSDTSLAVMNLLRPGGITLGIDFLFGLGR